MNNVTFGGDGWTFYETLGGGQGASARGRGRARCTWG
jgi:N-methylhydantoinase B